jgi:thioredoxin-related protein
MKEKIALTGWVLLSILLSFAAFILAQWQTADEPTIINFTTLFFAFLLSSRLSKYPFIGLIVLVLFDFGMLFLGNELDVFHFIQMSFGLLGVSVMILFKKKHYKSSIALFLVSVVYLIFIKLAYINQLDYDYKDNSDIAVLNENRDFLIGHHGEHPIFNSDTVYLVNFSFRNCLPCRKKKKSLKALSKQYKRSPFKIIEIHSFESMEIFQECYYFGHAVTYHDSLNHLAKTLKISGAPTEIIFSKEGKAVRRLDSFNSDAEASYMKSTSKLIQKLIHEK